MLDSRFSVALACALSALAGYVDGIGFIHLGGLFVSFMSGNSTRLGVATAQGYWFDAGQALGLIMLFVLGSAVGSLIVTSRLPHRQVTILGAEAVLLATAAALAGFGLQPAAVSVLVLAMGMENAVFQIGGGAGLGLTYVTGALVKVGQMLAAALTGGPKFGWLPNLLLWAALVAGSVLGASAYSRFALGGIWFAALVAALLAAVVAIRPVRRQ